jgi:cell division protein ZapA (FtsZ GTPase activity inhibitor)
VAINCHGEVGILFAKYGNIGKFLRIACGPAEQLKSIKDKIANDLKKFWNYKTPNNELEIGIDGCTGDGERFDAKFNYNEFRTLYEVLKSRDAKKIQGKYGTANFKEMVGEKNEDQFALMATETIMAEINKLVQERETEAKRLEDEHRRISNELWEKQKKEKEDSKNFYNEKIKELEDQIKAMRNGFQFTL